MKRRLSFLFLNRYKRLCEVQGKMPSNNQMSQPGQVIREANKGPMNKSKKSFYLKTITNKFKIQIH